jgi:omega-amidase
MKIALLQARLLWENPISNWKYFEEKINAIAENVDLIVLPEMFTSGFTMNPKAVAETMQGETVLWLQALAKAKNAAITGSLVIEENGKFYNRLVFDFRRVKLNTTIKNTYLRLLARIKFILQEPKK